MTANGCGDDGVRVRRDFEEKIRRHSVALVFCMVSLPLLFLLASRADNRPLFNLILRTGVADLKLDSGDPWRDEPLGGLLSAAFGNETCCRSRHEIASYWKPSRHLPSPYLVQKLRAYEVLHKRCGPNTKLFRWSLNQLKSNKRTGRSECNYVVWMPSDGLGNRIISIVSTFLYALLNDKVLLVDLPEDISGLFCEPFPDSTWVLPSNDFPVTGYKYFDTTVPQSFESLVRNVRHAKLINASVAYIHLKHDSDEFDLRFFCEESQLLLQRFPWLLLRSNQYFAPGLFLVSQYAKELDRLFPKKETVFNHLARYLLHPNDLVWGYITRYYETYLSNADRRVGIQTRIMVNTYEHQMEQMVKCSKVKKLLPKIDVKKPFSTTSHGANRTVVLVTSLKLGYFEKLRDMFYEHPTVGGQVISVYQPSHEEEQHTELRDHNAKALSEMYLLSFSDVLVTSAWSTFGYVAQGLGGLRPWILLTNWNRRPFCSRARSMEPCYHFPRSHSCEKRKYGDKGAVVPHVSYCEDAAGGIKLFDRA